ncbi:ATP-binding protein [Infirmifilum sp. SLHALR2]|nr:MAG: hypothetical protein B7L53_09560 [Thermofilum sp. NZ13]
MDQLGRIIGETSHSNVVFTAKRPPRVGEYVLVEYPETIIDGIASRYVLGMVERSIIGNPALQFRIITPEYVEKAVDLGVEKTEYSIGYARLIGWVEPLEKGRLYTPKYPPKPSAVVYEATADALSKVFNKKEDGWIRIGCLANHPDVPVYVNANAIISRHLAILAVTGAGKSNTVGVLVDRIVNELNGTVLLIDMHNEYGGIAGGKTRDVTPKIHPAKLTLYELYRLLSLDEKASKQRMYLRKIYSELEKEGKIAREPDGFLDNLESELEALLESDQFKRDRASIADLLNKLQELRERYEGTVLAVDAPMDIREVVEPGKANVLKLGSVDEEVADVVVSHYLERLLRERKRSSTGKEGYPVPVLVAIEEAHVLIPRGRSTLTKSIVARIAREGRKFGVGLCLVSQRPRNVDEDALSQTNNKIILRLVEPSDQKYVQQASETLSEEMLGMLASLDVGEAVVLGLMTLIPALVKIDKAENKTAGSDINAVDAWRKHLETVKEEARRGEEYDPYKMY